jgi:hypothetical protein
MVNSAGGGRAIAELPSEGPFRAAHTAQTISSPGRSIRPDQPGGSASQHVRFRSGHECVALRNAIRVLAVYGVRSDDKLKRLRRWQHELEEW